MNMINISYSMRTLRIKLCEALNRAETGEVVYIQRREFIFELRKASVPLQTGVVSEKADEVKE